MVAGGCPWPGGAPPAEDDELEPALDEPPLSSLPPQPATNSASAASANRTATSPLRLPGFMCTFPPCVLSASSAQTFSADAAASAATAVSVPAGTSVCSWRAGRRPRGVTARCTRPSRRPRPARRHSVPPPAEQPVAREREHDDHDRRADDAGEPVRRLVQDD